MTQKELSYLEDATMHESSIISICNDIISRLKDQELISFIQEEITKHNAIKEKLLNIMEEKANE